MRIAFIGHKTFPADYSGVEVYAEEVGIRLAERGHEVVSISSGPLPDGGVHHGVQCVRVGQIDGKHMGALTQALAATRYACKIDADVVHFMAMGPSIFAPIVRLRTRARIVVTVAGRDDLRRKWGRLARRLMHLSYYTCTKIPDSVICVSQTLADELTPVVRHECVHIANGVHVPDAPTVDIGELNPAGRPFVLFAARLVPEKRVEVLIDAFKKVNNDVDLVIAGGPAGTQEYAESLVAQAADDPRIRFIGHRSAAEVDALMRQASLYVLASELEGLPIALLEATGRGLPVVVSDLPCHREVLGDGDRGARIVPVGDAEALAVAITQSLEDPCAVELARRRADHVRATYTWPNVTTQVEGVYERALARKKGPRRSATPEPAAAPVEAVA